MSERSIFFDEWIRCLREQYMHVIREKDTLTQQSLTDVLYEVGFTDDELAELRLQATMHVDDVDADFEPDLNILQQQPAPAEPAFKPHPAECTCPDCVPLDESGHDEYGQPLEEPVETGEAGQIFAGPDRDLPETDAVDPPDDDGPTQLSLFD